MVGELSTCIKSEKCPLDKHTVLNLELLIGLRNRIEHHMPPALDEHMSAKYLACTLNYEYWLVTLFGAKHSLDAAMAFALHFRELRPAEEATTPKLPAGISTFLTSFEGDLTEEEYQHPRYAYRMIFEKRSVNHRGQADRIVEFLSPADPAASGLPSSVVVMRETERPKYLRKDVMAKVKAEGFPNFTSNNHTELWRKLDAKSEKNGYGVRVGDTWYWYQKWLDAVLDDCLKRWPPAGAISPTRAAVAVP